MSAGSYLDGLLPFGADSQPLQNRKDGTLMYDGSPHQFEDWKAQVEVQVATARLAKDAEDIPINLSKVGSKIFTGLHGDALRIVKEKVGTVKVPTEEGAKLMLTAIDEELFIRRREIAKDLHKQGTFQYGILSRASGEPMSAYISRRQRWWERVRTLDQGITIPDSMLADYMLDAARLTDEQKLHVRTQCDDELEMAKVIKHLKRLYSNLHEKESKVKNNPSSTSHDYKGQFLSWKVFV